MPAVEALIIALSDDPDGVGVTPGNEFRKLNVAQPLIVQCDLAHRTAPRHQ